MSNNLAVAKFGLVALPRAFADPMLWLGAAIGFTPILAGLLFRTYNYHVAPNAAEILRQLDVPFIFVELAVIAWAHHAGMRFRSGYDHLDRRAQIAFFTFIGAFWLSSAFISENPGYSMIRASFWFVHIGFGMAVFHLVGVVTVEGLMRLGAGLCAGLLAFLPLMAIHLLNAPEPATVAGGKIIWSSAIPGSLSIRHLGIWAGLVLSLAIGALYVGQPGTTLLRLAYALIFVAVATLCWSGTRSSVYGVAGALLLLPILRREIPPRRAMVAALVMAVLGVWVSTWGLPPDPSFGILGRDLAASRGVEVFTTGRMVLWTSMMSAFAGSPLLGVGEGAVHWIAPDGDMHHVQPHNAIVQMLSSWGLIACAAGAYLLSRLMLLIYRLARRDSTMIPLALMMNCLLIMSLADGVLYFSRFIMWFAAGAAIALAVAARDRKSSNLSLPPQARSTPAH